MTKIPRPKNQSYKSAPLVKLIHCHDKSKVLPLWNNLTSRVLKMSDSESDNEEFTIANDLVVTKYKMAGDIANR